MRDSRFTHAPASPSLNEACAPLNERDLNVSTVIANDTARQDFEPKEMPYNQTTDEGLASIRSKHVLRSNAEVKASIHEDLPIADGLSLRAPMAGQCENNQFPWQANRFGKQRS